ETEGAEDKLENVEAPHERENISTFTEPGTGRTSVKTFKTQTTQANESDMLHPDFLKPKMIPARFEGTMLTPVYFDGFMITPNQLDVMLSEATKKGEGLSIPIKLQGGMLTAAFKTMSQDMDMLNIDGAVPVKFHGRLQGIMESN
ncbi:unnamed protein product, partial [Lymnaea stagnalis]